MLLHVWVLAPHGLCKFICSLAITCVHAGARYKAEAPAPAPAPLAATPAPAPLGALPAPAPVAAPPALALLSSPAKPAATSAFAAWSPLSEGRAANVGEFSPAASGPSELSDSGSKASGSHATYMRYWRGLKNKRRCGELLFQRAKEGKAGMFDLWLECGENWGQVAGRLAWLTHFTPRRHFFGSARPLAPF